MIRRLLAGVLACTCLLACDRGVLIQRAAWPGAHRQPTRELIVIVAGVTDTPDDFVDHRVIEVLRARGATADVVLVYRAEVDYLLHNSTEVIWERVVAPARRRGVTRIDVVGISSGGLVALAFASEHAEAVDGIALFAPYMAPERVTDRIAAAGGLAHWQPAHPEERIERVWRWLAEHANADTPVIHLLFGDGDRDRDAHELIAEVLPPRRVWRTHGEHGWESFDPLWRAFVARDPLGWAEGDRAR